MNETLNLLRAFLETFFCEKNPDKAIVFLSEDVCICGLTDDTEINGRAQAGAVLNSRSIREYMEGTVTFEKEKAFAENVAMCVYSLEVHDERIKYHVTGTSAMTDAGIRLVMLQISRTSYKIASMVRMQERLQQNQEITAAACAFANMWVFTYDIDKNTIYTDKRLQREFGFPESMKDFPASVFKYDLILPEYYELYIESFEKLRRGENVVNFDIQTKLTDGQVHWLRFRGQLLDKKAEGSRVAAISAQKIDNEKAIQEQERLRLITAWEQTKKALAAKELLEQDRDMLCAALFNMVPMVISANLTKNYYVMLNYDSFTTKKAAVCGTYDALIMVGTSTIPDKTQQALFHRTFKRDNVIRAYESGKKTVVVEHQQVGDDGVTRWMETRVIFIKNEKSDDLHSITLTQDITERKEQELRLTGALDAAEAATKAKTDFLARMSHDMRTPMNAIIGLSALTLDDAKNPEIVRENMTKLRSSSDFLLGLLNDILDSAKIEDGSMNLSSSEYAYSDFLDNMWTMFQPQCDAKGIHLTFKKPQINPVIFIDKLRMNQVFFNIFSNAVKYTPAGGHIDYTIRNLIIDGKNLSVDFVISDTGIGMSEEFQKHLFEPFSQEDDTITPELQGSGLGLNITKQLLELMGGTIQIISKKGEGTTVIIHFDVECITPDLKHMKKVSEVNTAAVNLTGKKILLAEDHPLNAQIARRLLEKKHMTVVPAGNGRIAVDIFQLSEPGSIDAVLMDIRMPEMSGLDAARAIRALDRADAVKVPIIAMSANAYPEDIKKSLDAGMNGHLAKPVDPERLYSTLGKFL